MAPLSTLITTLLSPISAIPTTRAACVPGQTLPSLWTIPSITIVYTPDELLRPGNATFTLTNTAAATTETIHCPLRFNSLCELAGTPADKDLHLWLQVNLQVASLTINYPWACDGVVGSYVAGMAEVVLECPEESLDDGLVCVGGSGRVDGSVVLPEGQVLVSEGGIQKREEVRQDGMQLGKRGLAPPYERNDGKGNVGGWAARNYLVAGEWEGGAGQV
ncbi:hypothetical protein B0T25DRAFT_634527 [Lasiosphaeria hispida]|uniref:Uncharacterized protein n=1 Tax=Lasiosphaeria hispida TaxID=260671 RepID=A0AAJ0H8F7_9PEZI|nr:hypothetical protein B0T25DRAFT_634527 [Lasiosphaeria hispida]